MTSQLSYNAADEINALINHEANRDGHMLEGYTDSQPIFDKGGFAVYGDGFGFLLDPVTAGVVEVHSTVMPSHRHRSEAITLAAMDRVFTETGTMEIVTRVRDNKPAKMLAIKCGMLKTFERDGFEFFSIHINRWAARCPRFVNIGEDFHEALEVMHVETNHDHDLNHDQFVGITVQMAKFLPQKAEWFYNTWAHQSGYHPVRLLPDGNADIGNAVISFKNSKIEVLSCQ